MSEIPQQLKDGISSLGALITYHRTDSNIINNSEIKKLRVSIESKFGTNFLSNPENVFKERSKFVQQGHEAVTPINFDQSPDKIKSFLSPDQLKLYDLIWRRTLASQMKPSINLETTVNIKGQNFTLRARGNITKFKGVNIYHEKNTIDKRSYEVSVKSAKKFEKNKSLNNLTNKSILETFNKIKKDKKPFAKNKITLTIYKEFLKKMKI